jgi:hypothetical protein
MFTGWTAFSNCGSWSELRPPSGGWQFPKPAFKEQSLFNYIISGRKKTSFLKIHSFLEVILA